MATLYPYPPGTAPVPADQETTSTSLSDSLMTYIWSRFVPAFRARGFQKRAFLDVSDTIATTGYTAKVSVGQVMPSNLLSDGNTRVLSDLPPAIASVTLTQDRLVAFGLTQLVRAFIDGQATLPSMIDAAIAGLLNDMQEDIVSTLIANVPVGNVVGTYGANASETTFLAAVSGLIQNYMPQETYYGLLAPTAGAFDQFMQVKTVTWAQVRGSTQDSPVIGGPRFDQQINWNGGEWSASQLVPAPTVSGAIHASNVVWHPAAVAIAMRPMLIPEDGTGCKARNFTDPLTGVSVQLLQQWNIQSQASELVLKVLYGMASAQAQWSYLIKSA